jgi:hypothetical protein
MRVVGSHGGCEYEGLHGVPRGVIVPGWSACVCLPLASQVKSSQVKPSQVQPSQVQPSQVQPSQAKSSPAKSRRCQRLLAVGKHRHKAHHQVIKSSSGHHQVIIKSSSTCVCLPLASIVTKRVTPTWDEMRCEEMRGDARR